MKEVRPSTESKHNESGISNLMVEFPVLQKSIRVKCVRIMIHVFIIEHGPTVGNDHRSAWESVSVIDVVGDQTMGNS